MEVSDSLTKKANNPLTPQKGKPLTPEEMALVNSIPEPERYRNLADVEVVRALKELTIKQQLRVLRALGVRPDNPLRVAEDTRGKILDVIAEVRYGVDSPRKGQNPLHISIPIGGKKK